MHCYRLGGRRYLHFRLGILPQILPQVEDMFLSGGFDGSTLLKTAAEHGSPGKSIKTVLAVAKEIIPEVQVHILGLGYWCSCHRGKARVVSSQ